MCKAVTAVEVPMLGSLGFPELLLLLVIVVIIFGASKLPQLGKGLGEGIKNFRESVKTGSDEKDEDTKKDD